LRIRSIFLVAYCSKASVIGMLRPLTATCIYASLRSAAFSYSAVSFQLVALAGR
jgi:hypothetical protein